MPVRARPLSPHLQVYRWQIGNTLSILHRLTGVALAFGIVALAYWLVAIAGGEDTYETAHAFFAGPIGLAFLVGNAELVAGDAIVFHHQRMAQQRGPVELLDKRLGKLLECVREDDDLREGAEFIQKLFRAIQQRQGTDDGLDVR